MLKFIFSILCAMKLDSSKSALGFFNNVIFEDSLTKRFYINSFFKKLLEEYDETDFSKNPREFFNWYYVTHKFNTCAESQFKKFDQFNFIIDEKFRTYLKKYEIDAFEYWNIVNKYQNLYSIFLHREEISENFAPANEFPKKYEIQIEETDYVNQLIFTRIFENYKLLKNFSFASDKIEIEENFEKMLKNSLKEIKEQVKVEGNFQDCKLENVHRNFFLGGLAEWEMKKNQNLSVESAFDLVVNKFKMIELTMSDEAKVNFDIENLTDKIKRQIDFLRNFNFEKYIKKLAFAYLKTSFLQVDYLEKDLPENFYEKNEKYFKNFFTVLLTDVMQNIDFLERKVRFEEFIEDLLLRHSINLRLLQENYINLKENKFSEIKKFQNYHQENAFTSTFLKDSTFSVEEKYGEYLKIFPEDIQKYINIRKLVESFLNDYFNTFTSKSRLIYNLHSLEYDNKLNVFMNLCDEINSLN